MIAEIAEIADVCGKTEVDMLMSQGSWRLVALIMTEKMATSCNSNKTLPAHQSFDSASFFGHQDMAQRSLPWSNKKHIIHPWRSTPKSH